MSRFLLLADDDKDDRFFFEQAISQIDPTVKWQTVNDGEKLMLWLIDNVDHLPDIVFLDLNMPRLNGFACLDQIRHNRKLQHLFIAIYSTSTSTQDIKEAFDKGANIFINKPNGFDELKNVIRKVLELNPADYSDHIAPEKFVLEVGYSRP